MEKQLQTLQNTVTEMIKEGTDMKVLFNHLSEKVGNAIARMLIVQSALDLGVKKETVRNYLAGF